MYRIDVLFCKFVLDGVDFSRFFFLSAGNWLKYSGYAVKSNHSQSIDYFSELFIFWGVWGRGVLLKIHVRKSLEIIIKYKLEMKISVEA